MGWWPFSKDAGAKVIETPKAEAEPDFAKQTEALQAELAKYKLENSGLDVKVQGDKVVLSGKAASQELKEKVIMAAGNVAGISGVEAEDHDGDIAPVFYTVKKGDTLSAIAKTTLGSANRYNDIFEANRPMLSHPDKIYPGQTLRIPQD